MVGIGTIRSTIAGTPDQTNLSQANSYTGGSLGPSGKYFLLSAPMVFRSFSPAKFGRLGALDLRK